MFWRPHASSSGRCARWAAYRPPIASRYHLPSTTIGRNFFLYGFEPGGNRIEIATGADLGLDPNPPTRIRTAGERRRGIGWGTVFPPSSRDYGTPAPTGPD